MGLGLAKVKGFIVSMLSPVMHKKRAESIGAGVFGTLYARRLGSTDIGRAMAAQRKTSAKHGIKQVDRLVGNEKWDAMSIFGVLVTYLVGARKEILITLDWTEYPESGYHRIAVNLVTRHGRATPLVWKTVPGDQLKHRRTRYEREVLQMLADVLPADVRVILIADRGFGSVAFYRHLHRKLHWDYIIRFRGDIDVAHDTACRPAIDWVPRGGRAAEIVDALVTGQRVLVPAVVAVRRPGMKEAWILATSLVGQRERVISLYGRRMTCEEAFRDEKDDRFGLGFAETRVSSTERHDRLLALHVLATILLTLLGHAGECHGCDRHLRANTSKKRTHSLFRQGREYLLGVRHDFLVPLQETFWRLLYSFRPTVMLEVL